MVSVYSVLHERKAALVEDTLTDLTNLRRHLSSARELAAPVLG